MTMGIGTKAQRYDEKSSASDKYEAIGKVTEIGDISASRDTQDITAYDSASGYREYDVGLKDGGEVSISVRYRPNGDIEGTQHAELRAAFESGELQKFRFVFPIVLTEPEGENPTAEFDAYVTSFSMPIPLEEHISQSFTVKITGPITFSTVDLTP